MPEWHSYHPELSFSEIQRDVILGLLELRDEPLELGLRQAVPVHHERVRKQVRLVVLDLQLDLERSGKLNVTNRSLKRSA